MNKIFTFIFLSIFCQNGIAVHSNSAVVGLRKTNETPLLQTRKEQSKRILVYSKANFGNGDIVLAYKIARGLSKDPKREVGLYLDNGVGGQIIPSLKLEIKNNPLNRITLIESYVEANNFDASVLIIAAGLGSKEDFGAKRVFMVREYNDSKKNIFYHIPVSTTVEILSGFGEYGITTEDEEDIAQIEDIASWLDLRSFFSHLPKNVLEKIREGDYFFGYTSSPERHLVRHAFMQAVTKYVATKNPEEKDIVFVFPGTLMPWGRDLPLVEAFPKSLSIRSVNLYSLNEEPLIDNQRSLTSIDTDGHVNLHMFLSSIDRKGLLQFLKSSKYPFALVSGNQSLSEALSLGKFVFYEQLPFNKYVMPAFINALGQEFSPMIAKAVIDTNNLSRDENQAKSASDIFDAIMDMEGALTNYQRHVEKVINSSRLVGNLAELIDNSNAAKIKYLYRQYFHVNILFFTTSLVGIAALLAYYCFGF